MPLKRTVHRREARKRARKRAAAGRGHTLITPGWVSREMVAVLSDRLAVSKYFNRKS